MTRGIVRLSPFWASLLVPSTICVENLQNVCLALCVCVGYVMLGKVCTHLNRCRRIISWLE